MSITHPQSGARWCLLNDSKKDWEKVLCLDETKIFLRHQLNLLCLDSGETSML